MADVGAHLEIKWDVKNPIEVRDLGDSLKALADRYDDFAQASYGASESESRFYIQEIRKGSIIVEFVATSVGLIDQGLILKQFYNIVKGDMVTYAKGFLPKGHNNEKGRDYADIVRAVANADDEGSNIAFAFREKKTNGDEAAFVFTKGESNNLTSQVFAAEKIPEQMRLADASETEPRRELMRLYQHNLDPSAGEKKRTNHKAIISRYGKREKALLYDNQVVADELREIVSETPYGEIIFDVTAVTCLENNKVKAYRLIEIHDSFEDDEPSQTSLLDS